MYWCYFAVLLLLLASGFAGCKPTCTSIISGASAGKGANNETLPSPILTRSDSALLITDCSALPASRVRLEAPSEVLIDTPTDAQLSAIYGYGNFGGMPGGAITFHPLRVNNEKIACSVLPISVKPISPKAMFRSGLQIENLNFCPENCVKGLNDFSALKSRMSLGPCHISRLVAASNVAACSPISFADVFASDAAPAASSADVLASPAFLIVEPSSLSSFRRSTQVATSKLRCRVKRRKN
jgi:hypothetical protein